MGELIVLAERRAEREGSDAPDAAARTGAGAAFCFDLASPFTYLAAERVERVLGTVQWRPAVAEALHRGASADDGRVRGEAERRAAALGMPIVWPERFPCPARAAMRAAAYAAELHRGAPFTLAASRLAYCGGFDLDDPEVLAEAAAVAGIGLDECLSAAGDLARDGQIEAAGRRLLAAGADRLPAFRVGRTLFCGEERLAEAAAWSRAQGTGGRVRSMSRRVTS